MKTARRTLLLVVALLLAMVVGPIDWILPAQTQQNFPAISPKLLRDSSNTRTRIWMLNEQRLLIYPLGSNNGTFYVAKFDGEIQSRFSFPANRDVFPPVNQILDVDEFEGQLFVLFFDTDPTAYIKADQLSERCASWLWWLLGGCEPEKPAYFIGHYRLAKCEISGTCITIKVFDQGVINLQASADGIWAAEYKFEDMNEGREGATSVPRQTVLNLYSAGGQIQKSLTFLGLRSIDIDEMGKMFLLIMNDKKHPDRHGVFQLSGSDLNRVGGYRPWDRINGERQSQCRFIQFLASTSETLCIVPQPILFGVSLIRGDGSETREINSTIFPKRLSDGRVIVANETGQLMEIHQAMEGQ